jgi:plasmid stability protein
MGLPALTKEEVSSIMEALWRNQMAVLNIKNLPDSLYRKLQARAKRQHRSVAQEVTHLLSEVLEAPKPLSILDLKGLGKEHWKKINAVTHVEQERTSWD